MRKPAAHFHLPGLFEFYKFYHAFLPLYRAHRAYFYDWCEIASIYGAPEGCIWGGGRVGSGTAGAQEVLALMQDFGISARLTFSNCLLRPEHLIDHPCNALCRAFSDSAGPQNGVIVHSELLLTYLKKHYPRLYFVSSTTKVLTRFSQLRQELERDDFSYVVPDFRLNRSFAQLQALPQTLKDKTEFLCNEGCWSGCMERRACYEAVSRKISEHPDRSIAAPPRKRQTATASPARWKVPASSACRTFRPHIFPWAFLNSKSKDAGSETLFCWSFCSII